jgi:hypothetical protein
MIDIHPESSYPTKQHKTEIVPNIHQLADLTQNQPILGMNNNKYFLFQKIFSIDHMKINYFQL